jgi:hypothetical protein
LAALSLDGNGRIFLLATALAGASALLLRRRVILVSARGRSPFRRGRPACLPADLQNRFAIGTCALAPVVDTWRGTTAFYATLFSKLPVIDCNDGPVLHRGG